MVATVPVSLRSCRLYWAACDINATFKVIFTAKVQFKILIYTQAIEINRKNSQGSNVRHFGGDIILHDMSSFNAQLLGYFTHCEC